MIDRRLVTNFDWAFLALVLTVIGIGIANDYSATSSYTVHGTPYYIRQMYWTGVGLLLVLVVCSIDYHIFEDIAYWSYGILAALLVLVLLVGKTSMGATRWLNLGIVTIQPSEPLKIVIIMVMARYFATTPPFSGLGLKDIGKPLLILCVPVLLIMKQPDLGTAILVFLIGASIAFFVGIRLSTLAICAAAAAPLVTAAWKFYLREYQKNRILDFLNPERSRLGSGYHIIQSKIAVGSGGLTGKGFMQGTQSRLRFLPEQHTDFAFSVFSEEWGFAGCIVLIILYLIVVLWGLQIASRCNDRFGSLLAVGVTGMLFWHIVINIGMVIGIFPVVGVPLPFFSYGGTSMVTSMIGTGILLNISMRRYMF
ncbi:MAG TPA: rod shape-determining protein RodA [Verrucomicrobiae bacterium]|nr:rod shape-determining protein RodA [Verrucomicrobiae bacterium]